MPRLVILDRDGVINEDSDQHVKSPREWRPIPGSLEAIGRLNRHGFRVVVATNQSGIRRRLLDVETLNLIHARLHRELAEVGGRIEAIFFCPCRPQERCQCYKPRPGMLLEIGSRLNVALTGVPVIGDAARDVEAAAAVGARPMLVRTGKGERTLAAGGLPPGVEVFADLRSAADRLVREALARGATPR